MSDADVIIRSVGEPARMKSILCQAYLNPEGPPWLDRVAFLFNFMLDSLPNS